MYNILYSRGGGLKRSKFEKSNLVLNRTRTKLKTPKKFKYVKRFEQKISTTVFILKIFILSIVCYIDGKYIRILVSYTCLLFLIADYLINGNRKKNPQE